MPLEKIGRYIIQKELGRGGMATVYLARDPHFERTVAVKVLPREFMHETEFRARFVREAKTIAALEHPAIVPVYDFGEDDGQPYLVMRYMPGGSLTDRLKDGPLPTKQTAEILKRIGSALDQAHKKGIIHRDLKPSNILFDQYDQAYLADFGIVHISSSSAALTASGSLVGTPAYMSPEQVYGDKELDGRSDIYALGVILFQMLTGGTPFSADTPARMMMKHVMDPVPLVAERRPDLPPDYDEVITTAMAKDRESRYPTATAMSSALEAATAKMKRPDVEAAPTSGTAQPTADEATPEKPPPSQQPKIKPLSAPPPEVSQRDQISIPETGTGVPKWIWAALALLIIACLGGVAVTVYLVTSDRLSLFSGSTTATVEATVTAAATDTLAPTPQIDSSSATEVAAGRLATATAVAEIPLTATATPDSDDEATRESAIAARETLAAQSADVTATSTADTGQVIDATTLFGPVRGRLLHQLDDFIESANAGVNVRDFIMQVTLRNPFDSAVGPWDAGVIFRQSAIDEELRLVIRSDETWSLNDRRGGEDNFIGEGELSNLLEVIAPGANTITLIANEDRGFFFLNGSFVAQLDLSHRLDTGDIMVGTGFYSSSEREGASTDYEEFTVWPMTNAFGPQSGQLDHVADGLIKAHNAGVDLTNFMSDVTFINPYAATTAGWDYGFSFRNLGVGEQYWLIIDSQETWSLLDRLDGEDNFIDEGSVRNLDTSDGGPNRLTLIALGRKGYLLVNDVFVASFDLSSRSNSGDVEVVSTFFIDNEIEGETTGYEDFIVWSLP